MSMIKNYDDALDFLPRDEDRGGFFSRFAAGVGVHWQGLRDGLAAARAYHDLTARGVPHEVAVKMLFDQHLNAR